MTRIVNVILPLLAFGKLRSEAVNVVRDFRRVRMVERVYGAALPRRGGGVTFPIE